MKIRAHIRIAKLKKGGYKFTATKNPQDSCLYSTWPTRALPTISFGIDFNLPDEVFDKSKNPITAVNVELDNLKINGGIIVPEIEKAIKTAKIKQMRQ